MYRPLISIVVPAYNYARFLNACIDSVLAQTYTHWELLVIDNGSTDNTAEILAQYADPRIKKLHIEVNEGPVKAWAMGYRLAQGEYFGLLPADDMFTPTKLERQVAYLAEHPETNCVASYIDVIDDQGYSTSVDYGMRSVINQPIDFTDLKQWRWKHYFCIPSALYHKELCQRAGGVPLEGLTNICDWDFHVRLLGAGAKFAVIPEPLTLYRWHSNNTSKQRSTAHNQWVYSHTRSLLPTLRNLSSDYYRELGECLEALYLDPYPNYFLEDVPQSWRCAHLEALLNPSGGLAEFVDYADFKRHTESWGVDSENRAAVAAIEGILMKLRSTLLLSAVQQQKVDTIFPLQEELEKTRRELSELKRSTLGRVAYSFGKVKRELGRAYRRRVLGRSPVKSAQQLEAAADKVEVSA